MNARTLARNLRRDPDALSEAIDKRCAELMLQGAKFDPLEPSNFDEAISETLSEFPKNDSATKLCAMLRAGESVNALLIKMSADYNEKFAMDQAESDLDDAMNYFDETDADEKRHSQRFIRS